MKEEDCKITGTISTTIKPMSEEELGNFLEGDTFYIAPLLPEPVHEISIYKSYLADDAVIKIINDKDEVLWQITKKEIEETI